MAKRKSRRVARTKLVPGTKIEVWWEDSHNTIETVAYRDHDCVHVLHKKRTTTDVEYEQIVRIVR